MKLSQINCLVHANHIVIHGNAKSRRNIALCRSQETQIMLSFAGY
jgi:hypothetical protein